MMCLGRYINLEGDRDLIKGIEVMEKLIEGFSAIHKVPNWIKTFSILQLFLMWKYYSIIQFLTPCFKAQKALGKVTRFHEWDDIQFVTRDQRFFLSLIELYKVTSSHNRTDTIKPNLFRQTFGKAVKWKAPRIPEFVYFDNDKVTL